VSVLFSFLRQVLRLFFLDVLVCFVEPLLHLCLRRLRGESPCPAPVNIAVSRGLDQDAIFAYIVVLDVWPVEH
jgi:hypothetical protein